MHNAVETYGYSSEDRFWGTLLLASSRLKPRMVHIYRGPHIAGDRERSLCCREEYVFRKAAGENSHVCPDCLLVSRERSQYGGWFFNHTLRAALTRAAGWIEQKRRGRKYFVLS